MKLLQKNNYLKLIFVYIAVFSIIPAVTRNIIPYDMIENLYWGKELQLGYSKHPPLFAWISFLFYKISFSCPESLYLLTQLNLLLGFYFIFKTSKLIFEDREKSYASVLIFMASVCAVFGNEKFNASTILMSLLPAMFYFFIRMIKLNEKTDAFALGVFAALAVAGKYFAFLYIGCMGLFIIFCKECRTVLRTPAPYVAVITFLICISWHLNWVCTHDFITLKYALEKSTHAQKSYFSAFNFLLMQFVFFATSFWAFSYSYSKKMYFFPSKNDSYSIEEKFILFITIVPNSLLFFVSLITGMRIGSFWGTNMFMMLGTYLLIINRERFSSKKLITFVKRISVAFAIILLIKLGVARQFLKKYDPTNAINIREIARCIDDDWNKRFSGKRMKILKTDKQTAALHVHLNDSPSSYDSVHCDQFRIYNPYPQNENVVVTFLCKKGSEDIDKFRSFYDKDILFENYIPVIDNYVVYYAFINVETENE